MIIIATIVCAIVILSISIKLYTKTEPALNVFFWPALLFKMCAGVGVGLLYIYHYGHGDTLTFFSDASQLLYKAVDNPFSFLKFLFVGDEQDAITFGLLNTQDRSIFFIKILSIIALVSAKNYWISSAYFSFISFLACWYFVLVAVKLFQKNVIGIVTAILFFPSVVFWSSGILKESVALAALLFIATVYLKWWFQKPIQLIELILLVTCLYVVWMLKYYYLGVFIPVSIAVGMTRYLSARFSLTFGKELLVLGLGIMVLFLIISLAHPNFYLHRFLDVIVSNHDAYVALSASEDVIHYDNLNPTLNSVLVNTPWALISGLLRPFIWEVNNVPQFLAAGENLLLLTFSIVAFSQIKHISSSQHRLLVVAILMYTIALCALLSLSAPNFGTLVRYRIGFLPFLVILLLDHAWVRAFFNKIVHTR